MPSADQMVLSDRYTIIPRTLIFLICGKNVLLLKGALNKRLWAGLYNGVGGHIERGEDILTAAQRELQEETGLEEVKLIEGFKEEIKYFFKWEGKTIFKTVTFYLIETKSKEVRC